MWALRDEIAIPQVARFHRNHPKFLLVSIFGGSTDDFVEVAKKVAPFADGLELNFSCPHAEGHGQAICATPGLAKAVAQAVDEAVNARFLGSEGSGAAGAGSDAGICESESRKPDSSLQDSSGSAGGAKNVEGVEAGTVEINGRSDSRDCPPRPEQPIPLVPKLSPNLGDEALQSLIASLLEVRNVKGFTACNTFGPVDNRHPTARALASDSIAEAADKEAASPEEGVNILSKGRGGMSGAIVKPKAVEVVRRIKQQLVQLGRPDVEIIGMGGNCRVGNEVSGWNRENGVRAQASLAAPQTSHQRSFYTHDEAYQTPVTCVAR